MPGGMPIGRPWVVLMRDGTIAIDWGDGLFQEAVSGDFFHSSEEQVSHRAHNSDLDWLEKIGRVETYDVHNVFFANLPQRSVKTLE